VISYRANLSLVPLTVEDRERERIRDQIAKLDQNLSDLDRMHQLLMQCMRRNRSGNMGNQNA
jgi:hypothetical protein